MRKHGWRGENQTLKAVLRCTEPPGEIVCITPVIRRVLCLIDKVAPTEQRGAHPGGRAAQARKPGAGPAPGKPSG